MALVADRCRKGDHGSVAVIIALGIGAREFDRQRLAAGHGGFGPHDLLHRLRRRNPRPTARRPARRVMQPDLEPEILRSEEHTSELQSLMRISYAVFCLKKKKNKK